MGNWIRMPNMDVSNCVDTTDPDAVASAVLAILDGRYPGSDFSSIEVLVADLTRLYRGDYPGFTACDLGYHNLQHVLDVTLAMARLIDGHDGTENASARLGPELALAGIAAALFHDSGYIRRTRDSRNKSGAAYTRVHVSRSARFLEGYLPLVGLDRFTGVCTRIVHFTGYERDPAAIVVASQAERRLGELLGTADLIAQMADVDYAQKCREHLFEEFREGGLAGEHASQYPGATVFRSPDHLLELTPGFIRNAIDTRLERQFGGVFRYEAAHFRGRNLYMDAIRENCRALEAQLAARTASSLA
jgi:hypothetical protein